MATRRTQPHRRKGRVMENGPTLAAMLRGAGSLGNPQDVRRATVKRAKTPGNLGFADGADPQLGPAGLPPHSGASGMTLPQMLAALGARV